MIAHVMLVSPLLYVPKSLTSLEQNNLSSFARNLQLQKVINQIEGAPPRQWFCNNWFIVFTLFIWHHMINQNLTPLLKVLFTTLFCFLCIVCWSRNFCSMHENCIITSMHTYLTGEKFGELTLFEQWWKKKLGKLIDQPIGY